MAILTSTADLASPDAAANRAAWATLIEELRTRRAAAALGGNEATRQRHIARGKMLPRDRVTALIDPGSPFLEIAPLAAFGMYEGDIHAAGLIAGIGRVEGREVMMLANDSKIGRAHV